jgi:hypothetical protein
LSRAWKRELALELGELDDEDPHAASPAATAITVAAAIKRLMAAKSAVRNEEAGK